MLGPHVLDLMVHFGGAPQWCSATVTTNARPVAPNDFITGPEGLPMIAGDCITASFGLADGPTGFLQVLVKLDSNSQILVSPCSARRVRYIFALTTSRKHTSVLLLPGV